MINFVTDQSLAEVSGGWSGVSARIHDELARRGPVRYVGPIKPPVPHARKAMSKALRVCGRRGGFPFFGPRRLATIEAAWSERRDPCARFDLFHGATGWTLCRPPVTYGAYVDATFRAYLEIYSAPATFLPKEVDAIAAREGAFMRDAAAVFFGSAWMRDIAIEEHGLDPSRAHVVWMGGNVAPPDRDVFAGGRRFLFIALNFEAKGGRIAVEALSQVRRSVPDAELMILGAPPLDEVLARPGVLYGGRLRKTVPEDLHAFREHLATARALVHPTSMDTMGAVLVEAGYFGCPSITSRRFGIPEFVRAEETGLLIDPPVTADAVAKHMLRLAADTDAYRAMRRRVREDTTTRLSWTAFGSRLHEAIERAGARGR